MAGYRIISSDDHVFERPDLWTSRVEPRFCDRAPHVVRLDDGNDWWFTDGVGATGHFAGGSQAGTRFDEPEKLSVSGTVDDVRPGGYIPEEHVKDMDIDGVDVSVLYPTVGLQLYSTVVDSELFREICRVYNDWLAEFCGACPERLTGIAMVDVDDVGFAVKELERCANKGFVGAMITCYPPEERQYNLPMYEPLWAAAQDLGMPLSLHFTTNRPGYGQQLMDIANTELSWMTNIDHWTRMSLGHMIYSGVFERYPRLYAGAIETELSWVPHFVDRLDYNYTQRGIGDDSYRFKEDMLPSDYFHRNVFLGFQEDTLGIKLREFIGVDKLLWGSDYPHPEGTFPYSQRALEEILADCTEEEKAKIAGGNAKRVYRLN